MGLKLEVISGAWSYGGDHVYLYSPCFNGMSKVNEMVVRTKSVAHDIASSIPSHLADDLYTFIGEGNTSAEIAAPGKPLGGLLFMHLLYIVSCLPCVSEVIRAHFRRCLAWIGSRMGLGQASSLSSKVKTSVH
jgi:hypothetical protein